MSRNNFILSSFTFYSAIKTLTRYNQNTTIFFKKGVSKIEFLNNLDYLLKSHNMKRADLARAIGVAPSTINSWYARGSNKVSIKVLKDIAAYFNVSLEVLINGDNITSLYFDEYNYTPQELELIERYSQLLKESRGGKNDS